MMTSKLMEIAPFVLLTIQGLVCMNLMRRVRRLEDQLTPSLIREALRDRLGF
jgi:hypothetical protein